MQVRAYERYIPLRSVFVQKEDDLEVMIKCELNCNDTLHCNSSLVSCFKMTCMLFKPSNALLCGDDLC